MWLSVNIQYCFRFYIILGSMRQYKYHALLLFPCFFFHTSFFILLVQYIHTIDNLFTTVPPSSSVYHSLFVFNIFGVLKPSMFKRPFASSLLRTSKRGCPARQPLLSSFIAISLLCAPKMRRRPLQPLSSSFEQVCMLQSALSSRLSSQVCVLDDV